MIASYPCYGLHTYVDDDLHILVTDADFYGPQALHVYFDADEVIAVWQPAGDGDYKSLGTLCWLAPGWVVAEHINHSRLLARGYGAAE